jgi:hypothetical protein
MRKVGRVFPDLEAEVLKGPEPGVGGWSSPGFRDLPRP